MELGRIARAGVEGAAAGAAWLVEAGSALVQAAANARPPLHEVLNNYQVQDDRMVDWSPKVWGAVPVPFMDSTRLTATEGRLLDNLSRDRGIVGMNTFKDIRDQAFSVSEARYATPTSYPGYVGTSRQERSMWVQNDGQRDAFRHAYWNALLTREFGAQWTQQFATAHEAAPGNPADREAMDLYNNEVGRQIAVANPNATPAQLADLVQQAVTDGRMIVIDAGGNLQWSDRVPYGQHGIANDAPGAGGVAVPNGNASAH
jgi:hypothetical protein